jgi:hypothetical protein
MFFSPQLSIIYKILIKYKNIKIKKKKIIAILKSKTNVMLQFKNKTLNEGH